MWPFLPSLRLIRYLLVWKVNSRLIRVPRHLSPELSMSLGMIAARRLPTRQARSWHKALSPAMEKVAKGPLKPEVCLQAGWPLEAALLVYPGKLAYGQGELLLWELKLFGDSADHGFFLEVVLPAMEEAGFTADLPWQNRHSLWGHFDVHAVYVARGGQWEPLVQAGKLDLRYQAGTGQWAEGLEWGYSLPRSMRRLTWLTPFDLEGVSGKATSPQTSPLLAILEALVRRVGALVPGPHRTPGGDLWDLWPPEEQAYLQQAMEQAARTPMRAQSLSSVPSRWPGRWQGAHVFPAIPDLLIPYLQLAAVLHVGGQTHFGCGTFALSR